MEGTKYLVKYYDDQKKEYVTALDTESIQAAQERKAVLILGGFKGVHIQYSFQEGGKTIDDWKNFGEEKEDQIDKYTLWIKNKILEKGYHVSGPNYSKTEFGNSNYLFVSINDDINSDRIKIRISDHGVSNIKRMFDEIHIKFPTQNPQSDIDHIIREIRFRLERDKYFVKEEGFLNITSKFEVNESGLRNTDKIIKERLKKGTSDKKIYLIERENKQPTIFWRDKDTNKIHYSYKKMEIGGLTGQNPINPAIGFNDNFLSNVLEGKKIDIKLPNGEVRKGAFAIVDLSDIKASHNEETFSTTQGYPVDENGENINDRNYKDDPAAQAKVIEFAQQLEPDRLVVTSRTPSGTPIVTKDGIVVSGNNRTMSLKLAVKRFPEKYREYLQFLRDEITSFGFDQIVGDALVVGDKIALPGSSFHDPKSIKFKNPVLVRIEYDFPAYNTLELSKYNKETKKAERPIDKAIKLGKMIAANESCKNVITDIVGKYETFSEFYANRSDQKDIKDALLQCNILTTQELPAYYTETGFTEQGKELVENMLAGMVLTKEALTAASEGNARVFRQTIITSLPVLISNLSFGDMSIIPELNEAVILQSKIVSSKLSFPEYISQQSMFDEQAPENILYLNRLLASGRNRFKKSIEGYNHSVEENQGESLFGDKPTKEEIFSAHISGKIDFSDKSAIEKYVKKPAEQSKPEIKTETQEKEEPTMTPTTSKNPFINGNFFSENPAKILAEKVPSQDRWKKAIYIYKGTTENLSRIDVLENFIQAVESDQPVLSVINEPVTMATEVNSSVINNLSAAVKQVNKDIEKRKQRKTIMEKPVLEIDEKDLQTYTIREVFQMLNPEVSLDELRAFLWYKKQTGRPITNKEWLELAEMPEDELYHNEELVNLWVRNGLLYYYNGILLPAYLYLAENIYDKKNRLIAVKETEEDQHRASGEDADYIREKWGQDVLDNQIKALTAVYQKQYEKRLLIMGEGSEGLTISPVSKFAKETKIKTLIDGIPFRWKKITAATNKLYGKPDFLATGILDRDKVEFEELSLTDSFCYWLRTDETIQFKRGVNYADIIKVYIQSKSKPATAAEKGEDGKYYGAQLEIKKKEDALWERLKSKAKEEGDRLFNIFLSTQLTLNDKVKVETMWNRQYNGYVPINYNKVPVAFRSNRYDMGKPMEIKPEKREAAAFVFSEGSGLLAYDVGVGKTPSAIFTISQFIDTGYSKRPLVIVPNQTYKQWISEFKKFAGHIQVNEFYNLSESYLSDWKDLHGETRKVPEGSVSIITYEGMRQIGFSDKTLQEMGGEIEAILMQKITGDLTEKKRDRMAEKLNTAVEEMIGKALAKTVINIEDLGFDFIGIDEAHACKKVFTFVKGEKEENLGNTGKDTRSVVRYEIKSGEPSFNGVKGFMLCHYAQKYFGGNTLLLTATPFTNSPLEIYSMLAMVAHGRLKEMQLDNLTTFFDNFVAVSYEMVINSRLKPERRQVILGFNNLISLQTLVRRFINYKTGDEVKVPRPNKIVLPLRTKLVNGVLISLPDEEKVETILPLTDIQSDLMRSIKEYADGKISEEYLCSGALVEEEEDNDQPKADGIEIDDSMLDSDEKVGVRLLKAMNHARNLALSPYIFDCSGLGKPTYKEYIETSNKLSFVLECIKSVREYHAKEGSPMSGQVIYMDRGVEYFPLIREYLIREIGFEAHEVGIISSKLIVPVEKGIPKEDQKEYVKNLFLGKRFNESTLEMEDLSDADRIKVLIGSSTIKEGINLQTHSSCLYNCWMDWNPTDIQQLEGRIYRQGNKFNTVRIINPLMIDSMDIFMFQKIEEKTSRINTIWQSDGRTNVLKTEDFNPKELKYSLIKDPYVLAQMELLETGERMDEEIADLENQIKRNEKIIAYKNMIDSHTEDLEEWLEPYRPSEGRKRGIEAMIGLAQEVLRKQTDSQGRKMEPRWSQLKNKPDGFYSDLSPAYKQYWFDELVYSVRNLKREERDYLSPQGLQVKDLPKFSESIKNKIEQIREEKAKTTSDDAIRIKADEIQEYRAQHEIKPKTIQEVVSDFSRLNYLLSDVKTASVIAPKAMCPPVDAEGKARIDAEAIEMLRECIKNSPDTKLLHTVQTKDENGNVIYQYTPERKKLHAEIIKKLTEKTACIETDKPIAILTGGSPASGKSTFLNKYAPYLKSEYIYHIDADKVREFLPEYKGWNSANTHMETRDIVNDLLDSFDKPCKHDLLYDGTLTNAKKYTDLIRRLRKLGYRIFIAFMEIPKEVAKERSLNRYRNNKGGKTEFGRFVDPEIIEDFFTTGRKEFDKIKENVDGFIVVDTMEQKIIERGGESIPQDRNYKVMFEDIAKKDEKKPISAEPTKKDYKDAISGAKVMIKMLKGKEKKEWQDYMKGLKTMLELL